MTDNFTTTDARAPVPSDVQSLTVGPDGPILLQDHCLIEQMANFNRERVPERQPHAKGAGAFGRFEVTNDVRAYTRAAVLFYTSEGNFDIVGNNVPIFFIRDPIKFPNLIRSAKRRVDNDCHITTCSGIFGHCHRSRRIW
jgi:catalase